MLQRPSAATDPANAGDSQLNAGQGAPRRRALAIARTAAQVVAGLSIGAFQYLLYQWVVIFVVLNEILGLSFLSIIVETFVISITALSIIYLTLGIILPKARPFFCAAWIGACSAAGLVTYAWMVINREHVVF